MAKTVFSNGTIVTSTYLNKIFGATAGYPMVSPAASDGHIALGWADVKAYGATGDGTTSDSAAIVAAVASGCRRIYFPPGTYRCSVNLDLTGDLVLFGDPNVSVLKPVAGTAYTIKLNTGNASYRMSIQGLKFVSDAAATGAEETIRIGKALSSIDITGCHFDNIYGYPIILDSIASGARVARIIDCKIVQAHSTYCKGIKIENDTAIIEGNHFYQEATDADAITVTRYNGSCLISRNLFERGKLNLLGDTGEAFSGVKFTNNISALTDINLDYVTWAEFSHNRFIVAPTITSDAAAKASHVRFVDNEISVLATNPMVGNSAGDAAENLLGGYVKGVPTADTVANAAVEVVKIGTPTVNRFANIDAQTLYTLYNDTTGAYTVKGLNGGRVWVKVVLQVSMTTSASPDWSHLWCGVYKNSESDAVAVFPVIFDAIAALLTIVRIDGYQRVLCEEGDTLTIKLGNTTGGTVDLGAFGFVEVEGL